MSITFILRVDSDPSRSALIFSEITVDLASEVDHFLTEFFRLELELKLNERFIYKVDLLSRESSPGVWDAIKPLTLPEIVPHFTLSVFAELGGEERQLLASQELRGPDLCDRLGVPFTILLDGHENYPSMVLKAKLGTIADIFRQALGTPQSNNQTPESHLRDVEPKLDNLLRDFQRHGNPEGLMQLFSQISSNNGGTSSSYSSEGLRGPDDMNRRIEREQKAVNSTPDGHPDKVKWLFNRGSSFYARFERFGNLGDIENAIENYQAAVNLTPDGHPYKLGLLNSLGISLLTRFQRLGNLDDMNNAITRLQTTVNLTPDDHPERPTRVNNLGTSLLIRFEHLGNLGDIDSAIAQIQAAVNLTPDGHPSTPALLTNLGNGYLTRFRHLGNLNDMNNGITRHQTALNLTPDGHPDRHIRLNNLGTSLRIRFERLGNLDDIDNAITRIQAAVKLTPDDHPDKSSWLSNLGDSLRARFESLGNLDDVNNGITQLQAAVTLTPDGHPDKPSRLNNLGISLCARFQHIGDLDDIDNAIARFQAAVKLTPDGHSDKPSRLNNLGSSLLTRFLRLGNLDDIDDAIAQIQTAASLTPDGHPDKPSQLNNLGSCLRLRFQRLGSLNDMDSGIKRLQAAVNLTPDGHPDKSSWLYNLGGSLYIRFQRLGNFNDINNAIVRLQEAVNLTPDGHSDKPNRLSSLGSSLVTRFERLGNIDDVNNAIIRIQAALNLTPDGQFHKPAMLSNLGGAFGTRFQRLGNLNDIDIAIERHREAIKLTPDGHPDNPKWLYNLGSSFLFRLKQSGDASDAEACIAHLSAASLSLVGPPSDRLMAAQQWIRAASITRHSSLLSACECAISIIPLVAWLGLSISDRHQHLIQIGGIVRDAAAVAISLGECDKALEWLEQGRSIVWTQILQLRTPVDQLRAAEPGLADRLLHVSSLLDQGTQDNTPQNNHRRSPEEEARQYRALAKERDDIIEKIRSLPKFRDFLRPPKLHQLIEAARNGPVVVINVSEKRCDALTLVYGADEVIHIPLPDLTSERITQLQVEFNALLKSSGVRLRAVRDEEVEVGGDEGCKQILAELWDHLVKPVLDSLAFNVGLFGNRLFHYIDDTFSSVVQVHFLVSGGVSLGSSPSSRSMPLVYTTRETPLNRFKTMQYHLMRLLYLPY
ncbi:hypothetical protein FRC15_001600 [Serendipita sp. 397]|nr:hypothetical protein FRC15_001600 [Serendipita sp. 397]